MNPVEFLTLAEKLANGTDSSPAEYRSAVSRAYYATYLSTREMLNSLPVSLKVGVLSEHQVVQRFLGNCQVAVAVELSSQLKTLHECRKIADYEMNDSTYEDRDESLLCVARARAALLNLDKCASEKAKIKAGIVQYRKAINT